MALLTDTVLPMRQSDSEPICEKPTVIVSDPLPPPPPSAHAATITKTSVSAINTANAFFIIYLQKNMFLFLQLEL
jgi:hypothetical protein